MLSRTSSWNRATPLLSRKGKEMKLGDPSVLMVAALAAAMTLSFDALHAQSQKGDPISPIPPTSATNSGGNRGAGSMPVPAARGVSAPDPAGTYDPAQVEPDTNTLSGAEYFSVGSLQHVRNIFDPSISVSSWGQSGIPGANGQRGLHAVSLIGGQLRFNRTWSRYQFTTDYSGGENLYYGYQQNLPYQNLAVLQDIVWQRWRLHLRDDFTESPGASFFSTGMGGPGLTGQFPFDSGNSPGTVGQRFQPSQTIQTNLAMRYGNTVLGEAEYSLSRRSVFTFSGSYGFLHFTDAGYVSSRTINLQAGYDYLLDPKNSIAVLGSYGKTDYTGTAVSTTNYLANLAYGRKITGRLALQLSGGPEQIRVSGAGNGSYQIWTLSVNSGLIYELRRSGLSLNFVRGLGAGSGVLLGSKSSTFSGGVHHRLARFWSASANGGYTFNASLAPAGAATTNFNTWFIGANVGHQMGRHTELGFNASLLDQVNPPACLIPGGCGGWGLQPSFGMTVNWHLRPVE
jgi:hypothetical protein